MLRLLHGDIYTADRLVRFGLSDSDLCRRCFEKETIMHLLTDCSYTKMVLSICEIDVDDVQEVLGVGLSKPHLEIWCDILNFLIYRQHIMPPWVLVKSTLEKFKKGVAKRGSIQKTAEYLLSRYFGTT